MMFLHPMAAGDSIEPRHRAIPPYVPYRTFVTFLDSLKVGVPSHVDKSVLKSMSGGVQAWLKASLRALRLIDAASVPQDALHKLAAAEGAVRKRLLKSLFTSTYGFLVPSVDLAVTTPAKLESAFFDTGASGDTVRKSIAFMLAFAKDAGVELSPHLLKRGAMSRRTPRRAPAKEGLRSADDAAGKAEEQRSGVVDSVHGPPSRDWAEQLLDKFPTFDPAWNDDLKEKWFAGFERLMSARKD